MTDLISRDELMKLWDEYHPYIAVKAAQFDQALRKLPSAYPKKGKWFYQDTMYSCDQCHSQFYDMSPFCPMCGADMRGESDD